MKDDAKKMASVVRKYADTDAIWAKIGDGRVHPLEYAAEMIENLSGKCEGLEKDRDAWKRRCEAAERDIRSMLRGNGSCMYCGKFGTDGCSWKDCWNAVEWRGPCKENGGVEDASQTNPV